MQHPQPHPQEPPQPPNIRHWSWGCSSSVGALFSVYLSVLIAEEIEQEEELLVKGIGRDDLNEDEKSMTNLSLFMLKTSDSFYHQ